MSGLCQTVCIPNSALIENLKKINNSDGIRTECFPIGFPDFLVISTDFPTTIDIFFPESDVWKHKFLLISTDFSNNYWFFQQQLISFSLSPMFGNTCGMNIMPKELTCNNQWWLPKTAPLSRSMAEPWWWQRGQSPQKRWRPYSR